MNLDRVERILRLMRRQDYVGEVEIGGPGWRVVARKSPGFPLPPVAEELADRAPGSGPERRPVRSTTVGIFRSAQPPVHAGDHAAAGAALGSVESMGVRTPVVAEQEGYVAEVRVEDGDPVEYGQELFTLGPELAELGPAGGAAA